MNRSGTEVFYDKTVTQIKQSLAHSYSTFILHKVTHYEVVKTEEHIVDPPFDPKTETAAPLIKKDEHEK